ncbi:MAG: hypothetical protein L3J71_16825 [Victivallaceae bacterium]|nr:hypothetical protein [Victivallaceae bacterium]
MNGKIQLRVIYSCLFWKLTRCNKGALVMLLSLEVGYSLFDIGYFLKAATDNNRQYDIYY